MTMIKILFAAMAILMVLVLTIIGFVMGVSIDKKRIKKREEEGKN